MFTRQADGMPMSSQEYGLGGMTLRDYLAGQALAGMPWSCEISCKDQAKQCFQIADAMLAAREGKK
jgi:hypothetical protein